MVTFVPILTNTYFLKNSFYSLKELMYVCVCVCMPQVTKPTDTGRHQISWRWSYRQLQVAHMGAEKQTWVFWNGHWAISAVHLFLLCHLLLMAAILAGVRWNWKVFSISTSLMSSESKNVFVCLLAILDSIFWQLLLIIFFFWLIAWLISCS